MRPLNHGLIGSGFMGRAHAHAYRNARAVFGDLPRINLHTLCDVPGEQAARMADQFGYASSTSDWRALVTDPEIDIVSVTTPNGMHFDMAIAALEAGKHVHCEKPLALTLEQAEEMAAVAARSKGRTMVGYNYLHNPAILHAKALIEAGAIGEPVHFRGWVDEDYQADPDLAWTWRATREKAGLGTLGDLGCHLVSLAWALVGPIESLIADTQIIHETRPLPDGSGRADVENEDTASAIVRFAGGAQGTLCTSRSAWGRKNKLDFEVHGTKGMICFAQERMNELQLYQNSGPASEQGFKTILSGPEHDPFAKFVPAPGHQLGFGDLKIIEVALFLQAIASDRTPEVDFSVALNFERVIHAIDRAAATGSRVVLAD